jgi:hypothetical protein
VEASGSDASSEAEKLGIASSTRGRRAWHSEFAMMDLADGGAFTRPNQTADAIQVKLKKVLRASGEFIMSLHLYSYVSP